MSLLRYFVSRLWLPVLLIAAWEALSRGGVVSPVILPPPSKVGVELWAITRDGSVFAHLGASVLRVLEGFALAAVVGIALGCAIGLSPFIDRSVDGLLQVLRPIPPIGWFPLAILWFGIGEVSKVYIIFLGAFFPILVNVVDGIRQTDEKFIEVARVYRIGRWKFLRQVILPGALPATLTGLRVGLGLAWTCVVAAELIAAESGIGYLIVDARQTFRPAMVIVGMVLIGLTGTAMDLLLRVAEKRLIYWRSYKS